MILIDLNQVMIANIMMQIGNHQNAEVDESMIRHMVLNAIRSYRVKFHREYGELVICADDKNYWRKKVFPYYKAARKKNREQSEMDWASIFNAMNKVRQELKDYFPYKVLHVESAEADDIIGTIAHTYGTELNTGEPILILSGDKDYIQLHKYANVSQYSPAQKKWVKHSDPENYLAEHIIKGDAGDGIPNVLSGDNCFIMGIRQKPITEKRLKELSDINKLDTEVKRNYFRNKSLIDLSEVPEDIKSNILKQFETENENRRTKLFNYFVENRLSILMESINDF